MLIVFAGAPGTGKTTLARALGERLSATVLRIDAIEQAIRTAGVLAAEVGPAGYDVAAALAEANLTGERIVVIDAVNRLAASRSAWRALGTRAGTQILEIEVICSDPLQHRRRVETRVPDVPGLPATSWDSVERLVFEPWTEPHLILDTGRLTVEQALGIIEQALRDRSAR